MARPETTAEAKAVATLKARAALCGVVLHLIEDDHGAPLFIASKWAMTRQLHTIAEVDSFLARIDGKPVALEAAHG